MAVFIWTASGVFAQAPDSDFQFWNDNSIVIPIYRSTSNGKKTDRLSLLISQTNRIGTNPLHSVDERLGAGFEAVVSKHFTFSPSYLYRASHLLPVHWVYEHRIRIEGTYSNDWASFGIKNRGRVERLIRNSRSDITRFRNRTTFRVPVHLGNRRIEVFSVFEPYYEFTRGMWTIYDLAGGISTKLTNKLSTEIYFDHRGNLGDHILPINAVGFNFKIHLD